MALLVLSKQHKRNLAFLNEVDADGESAVHVIHTPVLPVEAIGLGPTSGVGAISPVLSRAASCPPAAAQLYIPMRRHRHSVGRFGSASTQLQSILSGVPNKTWCCSLAGLKTARLAWAPG